MYVNRPKLIISLIQIVVRVCQFSFVIPINIENDVIQAE